MTDSQTKPLWHLLAREKPPVGARCEYVIVTEHGTAEGQGRWDYQDGAAPRSGFYAGSCLVASDPSHTIWRLATLAQPEPEGVGDVQIMELMPQQLQKDLATVSRLAAHGAGPDVGPGLFRVSLNTGIIEHCRAVLIHYTRPATEPVPVAERLPGPGDCDAEGRCWLTSVDVEPGWVLDNPEQCTNWTHWRPHHALPLPQRSH
jgi:hypothetical protein